MRPHSARVLVKERFVLLAQLAAFGVVGVDTAGAAPTAPAISRAEVPPLALLGIASRRSRASAARKLCQWIRRSRASASRKSRNSSFGSAAALDCGSAGAARRCCVICRRRILGVGANGELVRFGCRAELRR